MAQAHQPGEAIFKSVLPEEIDWKPFPAFFSDMVPVACPIGGSARTLFYFFHFSTDQQATAAKIRPAAASASVRIVSTDIPTSSRAISPSNSVVATAAVQPRMTIDRSLHAATITWSQQLAFGSPEPRRRPVICSLGVTDAPHSQTKLFG